MLSADDLSALESEVAAALLPAATSVTSASAATSSASSSTVADRFLHYVLPSVCSYDWLKKRDLPAILHKKILAPSPIMFVIHYNFYNNILKKNFVQHAMTRARMESLNFVEELMHNLKNM